MIWIITTYPICSSSRMFSHLKWIELIIRVIFIHKFWMQSCKTFFSQDIFTCTVRTTFWKRISCRNLLMYCCLICFKTIFIFAGPPELLFYFSIINCRKRFSIFFLIIIIKNFWIMFNIITYGSSNTCTYWTSTQPIIFSVIFCSTSIRGCCPFVMTYMAIPINKNIIPNWN